MQKGDEASPSIILAGLALVVKLLINLEPDGIFGSNFVYLCILKRKSFATVLHPFFLQYGPCENILMHISYVPAQ